MGFFSKLFSSLLKPEPPKDKKTSTLTLSIDMEVIETKPKDPLYVVGAAAIPEEEKKYYNPDNYYLNRGFYGLGDEVIPFEASKSNLFPTRNGLYPAEILLLHYCSTYRNYPHPKNGFPGFWWYEYGIRDVIGCLYSLEHRGFLTRSNVHENIEKYYFILTPLGESELAENQYVPYLHKHHIKQVSRFNCIFRGNPPKNWRELIMQAESVLAQQQKAHHQYTRQQNPDLAAKWDAEKAQLNEMQKAEENYKTDNDKEKLIRFYENIWSNEGVLINDKFFLFRLTTLYISVEEFEKADGNLNKVQQLKSHVAYLLPKIEKYRQLIETHKIYASSPQTAAKIKTALSQSTVVQLKSLLASCNIPRTGRKAELIERIIWEVPLSIICEFYNFE